ncbi:MAG: haloacid dehalogenase-like hydrolase [Waddliaceae bacterium]
MEKSYSSLTIFDLDHTLLKSNSSLAFGKFLYRKGVVSFFKALQLSFLYVFCKFRIIRLEKLLKASLAIPTPQEYAQEFIEKYLVSLINTHMHEQLIASKNRHSLTVVLSAAPNYLACPIANYLGADLCVASTQSILDGKAKAKVAAELAGQYLISLSDTTAYTDSLEDLPLLELVGHPIAVNPNFLLKKICNKKGWRFVRV